MKTVERRLWCRSGIFIVKCDHVSHGVLITYFKQANFCWTHTNTFEREITYHVVFQCEQNLLTNSM